MYTNTVTSPVQHSLPVQLIGAQKEYEYQTGILKPLRDNNHWSFLMHLQNAVGCALTADEQELIVQRLKVKKLRKRQYFLQQGDTCKYVAFIQKGAAKMYSINERGQESIVSFCMENDWIMDLESFFENCESGYHIEALEEVELLLLDREQMFFLLREVPAFNQLFRNFQMKQMIESQKRINASLSMTAEERYFDLIASKPRYAQRFSQNMLACYLGVKPETLSRIRNRA